MVKRADLLIGLLSSVAIAPILLYATSSAANVPANAGILMRNIDYNSNFSGFPAGAAVISDAFQAEEAGPCPVTASFSSYCPYSSLDNTFTGPDVAANAATRDQFRTSLVPYMASAGIQYPDPLCNSPTAGQSGFQLYTHTKAYQVFQASFLASYKQYTGQNDFLPAGSRKMNHYMGNQACPIVPSYSSTALQQGLGTISYFTQNSVVLMTDNRYNPWRWAAPINEVHSHEQPSLSFLATATPAGAATTASVLAAALSGNTSQRILMFYDLDMTVDDYRSQMKEYRFTDMVGTGSNGSDLFSNTAIDIANFIKASPASMESTQMLAYYNTRYYSPTIQLSIAVNFQQDGVMWRDAEFMLASKNYLPSYTKNFDPVSDTSWNSYIPEGGNNGTVGWTRLATNGLSQSHVNNVNSGLMPVRRGGVFYNIPDGHSMKHLTGVIDLTDYYRFAIQSRIFPGTSGTWNGVQQTSLNSQGGLLPTEKHQINSIGVIYEVHGPFAIKVQINRLDVQVVSDTSAATPNFAQSINGHIDEEANIGGTTYLIGWACAPGRADSIRVDMYTGQPYPAGHYAGSYQANMPAEPAIGLACQDPLASPHRFQIPLSAIASSESGQPIFLVGISPNGLANGLVPGSGALSVPGATQLAVTNTLAETHSAGMLGNQAVPTIARGVTGSDSSYAPQTADKETASLDVPPPPLVGGSASAPSLQSPALTPAQTQAPQLTDTDRMRHTTPYPGVAKEREHLS